MQDAIPQPDLNELEHRCERIIKEKESPAYDWAWDERETKAERGSIRTIAPRLEEHNKSLLAEVGVDDSMYRKLLAEGTVSEGEAARADEEYSRETPGASAVS